MVKRVFDFIEEHSLLPAGCTVVVGFSGGADSVCLLSLLTELGFRCIAAHCNFHLRGEESDWDEVFCRSFATDRGIVFEKIDFDTSAFAVSRGISIEMAARELRYRWFEDLRIRYGAAAIAVAHHRDDCVETVLLNMIRGCGLKGLTGISPKMDFVVRPLLCVWKCEIETFLSEREMGFVTDSTNMDTVFLRNSIRHELLPLLERYNPSVRMRLLRMSEYLSEAWSVFDDAMAREKRAVMPSEGKILIDNLLEQLAPKSLLYSILSDYGFSSTVSEEVYRSLSSPSGKVFYSSSYRVVRDRSCFLIVPRERKEFSSFFIERDLRCEHLPIKMGFNCIAFDGDLSKVKELGDAIFDADLLSFPLVLRRWKKGDFFIPYGMKGRKKVSDYFNDHKYSLVDKEEAWLLCSGDDIIWIVGGRTDNRYRVVKNTQKLLCVTLN